jgi:nucleotide-binding universal stress UspA family protein
MIEYKNVLFCTDFSEDANIAFLHSLDLAKKHKAKLHILHVPHSSYAYCKHPMHEHAPEGSQEGVTRSAKVALTEEYENRLDDFDDYLFVVKEGSPDVEIIRYAKGCNMDVIIMGALGKSELERIEHGSTVSNVSKYAHCHVIAIRNPASQFTLPGSMY